MKFTSFIFLNFTVLVMTTHGIHVLLQTFHLRITVNEERCIPMFKHRIASLAFTITMCLKPTKINVKNEGEAVSSDSDRFF